MDDLTGFQRDLLTVIAGLEEPHGIQVGEEVQQYYETEIQHARVYSNLDDLAEKGLIKKGEIDKRTNSYTLTQQGRQALKNRAEW